MDRTLIVTWLFVAWSAFLLLLAARAQIVHGARMDILFTPPLGHGLELFERLPGYFMATFSPRYWLLWNESHWRAWLARGSA